MLRRGPNERQPQIKRPTQAELDALDVVDRLALLEQHHGRKHQWLNGLVLLIGVVFTGASLIATALTLRNGQDQLEDARQQQITGRYATAVSDLGSNKAEVRLGAIYALQRIAVDSPRDRPSIANVLSAYIRLHAQDKAPPGSDSTRLAVDVQTALTVLFPAGRNGGPVGNLDPLHGLDLSHVDFHGKDLTGVILHGGVDLTGANLKRTILNDAILNNAIFNNADLEGASLRRAELRGAALGTDLSGVDLSGADLHGAGLAGAKLTGANLTRTNLSGAYLGNTLGADLTGSKGTPEEPPPASAS
ncbi:hypothetical protein GCM10010182_00860 [Actinomadura cremea]|nr:hypothetical protein GCM10010182_00860 [Actinomadura cremea]